MSVLCLNFISINFLKLFFVSFLNVYFLLSTIKIVTMIKFIRHIDSGQYIQKQTQTEQNEKRKYKCT